MVETFDGYAVFTRRIVRHSHERGVREVQVASGLSYEEARDFSRSLPHSDNQQRVIRFQGETGGGD